MRCVTRAFGYPYHKNIPHIFDNHEKPSVYVGSLRASYAHGRLLAPRPFPTHQRQMPSLHQGFQGRVGVADQFREVSYAAPCRLGVIVRGMTRLRTVFLTLRRFGVVVLLLERINVSCFAS